MQAQPDTLEEPWDEPRELSPQSIAVPSSQSLESITDRSGTIVQISEALASLSGYRVDELLGQPHSQLRHPDMPKAAFADMWLHLEQGQTWRGIVKNRCKNTDYYWFEAIISPIFEGERLLGFHAVRYPAKAEDIEQAELIYQELR